MLETAPFVAKAVGRPWWFYLHTLLWLSPLHLVGLLFVAVLVAHLCGFLCPTAQSACGQRSCHSCDSRQLLTVRLLVFSLWPIGFLGGLTLMGSRGSGFQSRFLLPLLPATCILVAAAVTMSVASFLFPLHELPTIAEQSKGKEKGKKTAESSVEKRGVENSGKDSVQPTISLRHVSLLSVLLLLIVVLLLYSFTHSFFYGTLFAPLFAEVEYSVRHVLIAALSHPYQPLASKEAMKFLRHFGLALFD